VRRATSPIPRAEPPAFPRAPRASWGFRSGEEIVPGRSVQELLGGGDRFEAYLAWNHRRMARTVIKIVRPDMLGDPRTRRSVSREGGLMAGLRHPGLARLLDMDAAGERPFIELEYVEGPRLSTLIRRNGGMNPRQAVGLARRLARTLRFLHAQGVLHLDVKPSNVSMGPTPRLIDLSVARRTERATRINGFVGTDAYMSPEQADPALWSRIGPGSDAWGLSATLYHAVARRIPHARGRHDATGVGRFPQLSESPTPLDPVRHSPVLVELIMAGLQRAPEARPTLAEVVDRLDEPAARAGVAEVRFR
jgi:serine/threonine protein kinase